MKYMKHNPVVVMKTTLNGSRHIVMPKRRLRIHRASNEIPFFLEKQAEKREHKNATKEKDKTYCRSANYCSCIFCPHYLCTPPVRALPLVAGRGPVIEPIRYGHTNRVTRVRGVQTRHFCIGNHWYRRVDALHALKRRVIFLYSGWK